MKKKTKGKEKMEKKEKEEGKKKKRGEKRDILLPGRFVEVRCWNGSTIATQDATLYCFVLYW